MTRFLSTVRWNLVLQFRYGFYFVSAFFILVWVGFLRPLPHDGRINFGLVLAGLMVLDLTITNFYYMGAMVLLEKGEGTLTSLVVTPLRAAEYLLAKILSLMLLALLEGTVLAILINGFNFNPLPWFAGLLLLSGFYTLLGFAVIARYHSINESLLSICPHRSGTGIAHSQSFRPLAQLHLLSSPCPACIDPAVL